MKIKYESMSTEKLDDIMTATDGGKTYVTSQSLQTALAEHSKEMAETRKWQKILAVVVVLNLLGLLAIMMVKWDTVWMVVTRLAG